VLDFTIFLYYGTIFLTVRNQVLYDFFQDGTSQWPSRPTGARQGLFFWKIRGDSGVTIIGRCRRTGDRRRLSRGALKTAADGSNGELRRSTVSKNDGYAGIFDSLIRTLEYGCVVSGSNANNRAADSRDRPTQPAIRSPGADGDQSVAEHHGESGDVMRSCRHRGCIGGNDGTSRSHAGIKR